MPHRQNGEESRRWADLQTRHYLKPSFDPRNGLLRMFKGTTGLQGSLLASADASGTHPHGPRHFGRRMRYVRPLLYGIVHNDSK